MRDRRLTDVVAAMFKLNKAFAARALLPTLLFRKLKHKSSSGVFRAVLAYV